MKRLIKIRPFLIVSAIVFYMLPIFIIDTGSAMFILLELIPISCFVVSLILGIKNSFVWFYPIINMLIFIPSIFIFYNESAAIYIVVYGAISLFGMFLGCLISKKINK